MSKHASAVAACASIAIVLCGCKAFHGVRVFVRLKGPLPVSCVLEALEHTPGVHDVSYTTEQAFGLAPPPRFPAATFRFRGVSVDSATITMADERLRGTALLTLSWARIDGEYTDGELASGKELLDRVYGAIHESCAGAPAPEAASWTIVR